MNSLLRSFSLGNIQISWKVPSGAAPEGAVAARLAEGELQCSCSKGPWGFCSWHGPRSHASLRQGASPWMHAPSRERPGLSAEGEPGKELRWDLSITSAPWKRRLEDAWVLKMEGLCAHTTTSLLGKFVNVTLYTAMCFILPVKFSKKNLKGTVNSL